MTALIFERGGYTVMTTSWSAWESGGQLTICYLEGADGISFFDSAVSTKRAYAKLSFDDFLKKAKANNPFDLRQYQ